MEDRTKIFQIKLYQSGTKYLNYVLHGSFRITSVDISSFFFCSQIYLQLKQIIQLWLPV